MNPFGLILIALGAYLWASDDETTTNEGKPNEQNSNAASGNRGTGRNPANGARKTGARSDRPGRISTLNPPNPITEGNNDESSGHELEGTGDDDSNQPGNNRAGEQHGSAGRGETESVKALSESDEETGQQNEREKDHGNNGGDNGGNVRSQSSGGNAPNGSEGT